MFQDLPSARALAGDHGSLFFTRLLSVFLTHERLLQDQLAKHGRNEADGASFIREVGASTADASLRHQFARHADDESKHARIYHALSARIAGDAPPRPGAAAPADDGPDESRAAFDGSLIHFFLSLHVAEIRNDLMLWEYLRQGAAIGDRHLRTRVLAALRIIHADERRHVDSTRPFVADALERGELTLAEVDRAFGEFRTLFWQEVEDMLRAFAAYFRASLAAAPAVGACAMEPDLATLAGRDASHVPVHLLPAWLYQAWPQAMRAAILAETRDPPVGDFGALLAALSPGSACNGDRGPTDRPAALMSPGAFAPAAMARLCDTMIANATRLQS